MKENTKSKHNYYFKDIKDIIEDIKRLRYHNSNEIVNENKVYAKILLL